MIAALADRLRNFEPIRRIVLRRRDNLARSVDRRLGIKTTPDFRERDQRILPKGARKFTDSSWHESLDYRLLDRFLKPLKLAADDVVFDIGCGMGRIVCTAALLPIRKVVGVELDDTFAEEARRNAKTLKGRKTEIEILTVDAAQADYSNGTVFILFNPFGPQTMAATLNRIQLSLRLNPRAIRVAYFYPAHERVYSACGWLELTGRDQSVWFRSTASYWRNLNPDGSASASAT